MILGWCFMYIGLLDTGSLLVFFALACSARYGSESLPVLQLYLGIYFFYLLTVAFLHIADNTFSGILRKGYYKEFSQTVKHVLTAELVSIAYLFVMQQSDGVSGIVVRIWWKRFLRKCVGRSEVDAAVLCRGVGHLCM